MSSLNTHLHSSVGRRQMLIRTNDRSQRIEIEDFASVLNLFLTRSQIEINCSSKEKVANCVVKIIVLYIN